MMKSFFLGHMIWEFRCEAQVKAMILEMDKRGSKKVFDKIKNISIWYLDSWENFINLFETCLKVLRHAKVFPILESLEIYVEECRLKCYQRGFEDDTVRLRYLATRCYQLIKVLPRLTICLNGRTSYDLGRMMEFEYEKRMQEAGYGFTEDEMIQFEKGTFEDAHGLPSFTFRSKRIGVISGDELLILSGK